MNLLTRWAHRLTRSWGVLFLPLIACGSLSIAQSTNMAPGTTINFDRDIKPILANHCYGCHGPDENSRQADLRLDDRSQAVASSAIVPRRPSESQLVSRINSDDPDTQMPPPEHKRPLNQKQRELLSSWIDQGAEYAAHWAFTLPSRKTLQTKLTTHDFGPNQRQASDVNLIDTFVHLRLKESGLTPNSQADRNTLLRRVTLDLTGLPPTLEELDAFLNDHSDTAYEKIVDRLLGSISYAERMSMDWLDLARYADTNGYNNDEDRTMWPWRDWVIQAFHQNMPFDQFLIEQLAGDLLPEPTQSQLIATAFLRNQGHNTEGGIIQEEYRVEYVADRVHTTATAFLGLSVQCARCHDHKYDPISQQEYYQFYAFFNNLDEKQASYSKFVAAEPFIRVPTSEQQSQLKEFEQQLADTRKSLEQRQLDVDKLLAEWLSKQTDAELAARWGQMTLHHLPMEDEIDPAANQTTIESLPDKTSGKSIGKAVGTILRTDGKHGKAIELSGSSHFDLGEIASFDSTSSFAIGAWIYPTSSETMAVFSKMDDAKQHRGYDLLMDGGKLSSHLVNEWPAKAIKVATKQAISLNEWHHVVLTYNGSSKADSVRIFVDNQSMPLDVLNDSLSGTMVAENTFHLGFRGASLPFRGRIDELVVVQGNPLKEQVAAWFAGQPLVGLDKLLREPASQRSEEQTKQIREFYLTQIDQTSIDLRKTKASVDAEIQKLKDSFAAVMVLKEMTPTRETFVLQRGQYDQPKQKVSAGLPIALTQSANIQSPDRLGLARWLVDPQNPLTARVAVNRWWQHYFGTGLVKTAEDFGITGESPSHPELLDYLSLAFIESGWDVKALHKLIVMSATYRRESKVTADSLERDPENRLLARGPRFRMSAETVRDNALAISGLLKNRVGGPSVKPYQPDGLWEDVSVERRAKYVPDLGEGLYRRSLYTFWKRTCPPPSLMSFDAPNREVCYARRPRTNTPLQSLVLLNDPTYVEAARLLAQQMLASPKPTTTDRIHTGYRRCLTRDASEQEITIMTQLLNEALAQFRAKPEDAKSLNAIGHTRHADSMDETEVAAWTILASTLLNLDEVVTKR